MKLTKPASLLALGTLLATFGFNAVAQDMYGTFSSGLDNSRQELSQPTKSRAEVIAEAQRLKLDDMHTGREMSGDHTSHVASVQANTGLQVRTREAVRTEAIQPSNEVPANVVYGSIGP